MEDNTLNNSIYLTLGEPMDPYGNKVNSEGVSTDEMGIPIDIRNYVFDSNGNIIMTEEKIKAHTQSLRQKIAESYYKQNIVTPAQFLYIQLLTI